MNIAVIPARGGSKRIPGKNVRDFCGQPVIKYSIDAAIDANVFDHIFVSTDNDEISRVSTACGASVPFTRPHELSDDFTPTISVIRHATEWAEQKLGKINAVCCLYATAPFVEPADLKRGLEMLEKSSCQFAFPVTTFPFPIMRALEIQDERIKMIWPENELKRSQDLVEAWHDAGQFYWGTSEAWKTAEGIYASTTVPIRIPRWRVQDIDTEEDWSRAERMYDALCRQDAR